MGTDGFIREKGKRQSAFRAKKNWSEKAEFRRQAGNPELGEKQGCQRTGSTCRVQSRILTLTRPREQRIHFKENVDYVGICRHVLEPRALTS